MDEAEKQRRIEQAVRAIQTEEWDQEVAVTSGPYQQRRVTTGPVVRDYSLAQVQLTDGSVVGMTITANPTIGSHLTKEMANTGFLYIYNESESLIIKADRVVAVKITKMTT
jgi:hypothetical protein